MNIRRLGAPLIHALPTGLREATEQFAAEVVIRKRHLRGLIKARKYRGRRGMAMQLGSADKIKAIHYAAECRPCLGTAPC